jgi:hypothetical protein
VIDCRTAGPTLNVPEPEIEPTDAVIVELPTASALAKPVLLTVATLAADEFHTAVELRSWVVLSVKCPVVVNCWVIPAGTVTLAGVTTIELTAAAVTVRAAEPEIGPEVAEIVTLPSATLLASPLPSIEAMVGSVEFQVTGERVCVLPSVNVPTAANCAVVPRAMEELAEFTAIETRLAGSTVKLAEPVITPEVALIVTVPTASADARPELSTEAMAESDELQVALTKVLSITVIENSCSCERLSDA